MVTCIRKGWGSRITAEASLPGIMPLLSAGISSNVTSGIRRIRASRSRNSRQVRFRMGCTRSDRFVKRALYCCSRRASQKQMSRNPIPKIQQASSIVQYSQHRDKKMPLMMNRRELCCSNILVLSRCRYIFSCT